MAPGFFDNFRHVLSELRRRNVYRVGVAYLVAGFMILELADMAAGAFGLPGWFQPMVWVLLGLGFPIALVLAWALQVTPEGVRATSPADDQQTVPRSSEGGSALWVAVLAAVVLVGGGLWYLNGGVGTAPAGETASPADPTRTATPRPDSADRPFVAVLPLENLSPSEENKFFAAGIHEEILNQLSKVSGLGVFARTTMRQYEDTEQTVYEIGRELGAEAVLEGSVRRAAGTVRISAQLINPQSRDHLWSRTYEKKLSPEAVFDIQVQIAEQIASALNETLTPEERNQISRAPTANLAAYEAYLRGRSLLWQYLGQWDPSLLNQATESLRAAVRADPSFAEAQAWLSIAYTARQGSRYPPKGPWLDSAEAALDRAERINPELAPVHLARAKLYVHQDSTSEETETYRRALALQPSNAYAKAELSENLVGQDQYVEAVRLAREAVRLDPRRPWILQEMADQLREVGLYERAAAWDRHILEIEPGYFGAYNGLSGELMAQGQAEQALAAWEEYVQQTESPVPQALFEAAMIALAAEKPARARSYLNRFPEAVRQQQNEAVANRPERRTGERGDTFLGSIPQAYRGLAELRLGNESRGRALLQAAIGSLRQEIKREEGLVLFKQMTVIGALATLGEREQALREFDRVELEEGPFVGVGWLQWDPLFDSLRSADRVQQALREAEARQKRYREQVLALDLDLYPPGAEPDSGKRPPKTDA